MQHSNFDFFGAVAPTRPACLYTLARATTASSTQPTPCPPRLATPPPVASPGPCPLLRLAQRPARMALHSLVRSVSSAAARARARAGRAPAPAPAPVLLPALSTTPLSRGLGIWCSSRQHRRRGAAAARLPRAVQRPAPLRRRGRPAVGAPRSPPGSGAPSRPRLQRPLRVPPPWPPPPPAPAPPPLLQLPLRASCPPSLRRRRRASSSRRRR